MSGRRQLGYSLTPHGAGRWRVRIYGGTHPTTGKPRQLSRVFTAATEREAHRHAQAIAVELRSQPVGEVERRGTVAELADDWLTLKRRQGRSPVTLDGYRFIVERIVERFGRALVVDLTGRDIDRWYGELIDQGHGASTIVHTHAVLRGMLRQAVKWGLVEYAATDRASPPPNPRPEIRPPSVERFAEVVRQLDPPDLRHAIELAALTGMRRGEVCGLWWSDVEGSTLTVRRSVAEIASGGWEYRPGGKSGRVRSFAIGATVVAVLDAQRAYVEGVASRCGVELAADGPVFADMARDVTGGTPRRPDWLTATWRRHREALGLPGVRVHDLRHLNITAALSAGVPARTMADRAGHARVSITTDTYGHGTDEAEAFAVEVIEQRIGRALRP